MKTNITEFIHKSIGLPPPWDQPDPERALYIQAACEWVETHTSFRFEEGPVPGRVQLFVLKYCELMESGIATGVRSESIGGMSQSFEGGRGLDDLVRDLAAQFLEEWYKTAGFVPAVGRWN